MLMKQKLSLLLFGAVVFIILSCRDEVFVDQTNERTHSNVNLSNGTVYMPNVLYLQLTEEAVDTINPQVLARKMGVERLDKLFPENKKFAARHRKAGLNRWYCAKLPEKVSLTRAFNDLSAFQEITLVEPVRKIKYESSNKGKKRFLEKPYVTSVPPTTTKAVNDYPFNDPYLESQWHYQNDGSLPDGIVGSTSTPYHAIAGADINLFKAWKATTGRPEVIVNVVDGGIDYLHEDLAANMHINEAELNGQPGVDDDENGMIDDIYGFNFITLDAQIIPHLHGTHVAGTIAAVNNNGIGVCGVAGGDGTAGSGVRLISSQIFMTNPEDTGEDIGTEYISAAIVYGADNGAVISQNSWYFVFDEGVTPVIDEATRAAIDYFIKYAGTDDVNGEHQVGPMKGGIVIFCAGNDDSERLAYPAAIPEVIAVAAMNICFEKTWYSNYGEWVDITAPGGDFFENDKTWPWEGQGSVLSTANFYENMDSHDGYCYLQGTSMACPHVSGIAALIVSKFGGPGFTPDDLRRQLFMGMKDIDQYNPNYAGKLGRGYIDAEACLRDMHHAPAATGNTEAVYIGKLKEPQTLDLSNYITDEDEDPLTYNVSVSPAGYLEVSIKDGQLTVSGLKYGEAEIHIKATDPFKYSGETTIKVNIWDETREMDCYPNPVTDKLNVLLGQGVNGEFGYSFYTSGGRKALEGKAKIAPHSPVVIDVSALKTGSYAFVAEAGGKRITRTIIKK